MQSQLSITVARRYDWSIITFLQVDLTAYVEKHEFVFDAVLDEEVSNDEVSAV